MSWSGSLRGKIKSSDRNISSTSASCLRQGIARSNEAELLSQFNKFIGVECLQASEVLSEST